MSQYAGMDKVIERACTHVACPHFRCVGGDPSKSAQDFFQELRVRAFNRWVRDQRRSAARYSARMHFLCGTRHGPTDRCMR